MKTVFTSQVQNFLKKNQRETQMTPCCQREMRGRCTQEPEDNPPFLGKVTGEEEKRRRREMKSAEKGDKEVVEEEESSNSLSSLDAERNRYTQVNNSFNSATETVDIEREEEQEQPGRQLTYLEIPDFIPSDAPADDSGKHSICQGILMA